MRFSVFLAALASCAPAPMVSDNDNSPAPAPNSPKAASPVEVGPGEKGGALPLESKTVEAVGHDQDKVLHSDWEGLSETSSAAGTAAKNPAIAQQKGDWKGAISDFADINLKMVPPRRPAPVIPFQRQNAISPEDFAKQLKEISDDELADAAAVPETHPVPPIQLRRQNANSPDEFAKQLKEIKEEESLGEVIQTPAGPRPKAPTPFTRHNAISPEEFAKHVKESNEEEARVVSDAIPIPNSRPRSSSPFPFSPEEYSRSHAHEIPVDLDLVKQNLHPVPFQRSRKVRSEADLQKELQSLQTEYEAYYKSLLHPDQLQEHRSEIEQDKATWKELAASFSSEKSKSMSALEEGATKLVHSLHM